MNLPTRRDALAALAAGLPSLASCLAAETQTPRLATFSADVTPRLGHPLLGGHFAPATSIDDPLYAKGLVLSGFDRPIVLAAIDWCEIRNDAYAAWRGALAAAADTSVDRVLLASVHQHDAPLADLGAQRILAAHGGEPIIDAEFHRQALQRVAAALGESLARARPVTHIGLGQARVERVASSRRVVLGDGTVTFRRMSRTADDDIRRAPEGAIDPWLKTISFFSGEQPLAAVSAYATHPMSYYGGGTVSADFVGLARAKRQAETPGVAQIYFSGCSGDVTAGKYNDGSPQARRDLTDRLHQGMVAAWEATRREPIGRVVCRSVTVTLPHSDAPKQQPDRLRQIVADPNQSRHERSLAALGLSSLERNPDGHRLDVQAIDFGSAQIVLLPGETLVAYQLRAQQLRQDQFVMALGYGECAPGYVPTDEEYSAGYVRDNGWCWVRPGAEVPLMRGLSDALAAPR